MLRKSLLGLDTVAHRAVGAFPSAMPISLTVLMQSLQPIVICPAMPAL